MSDTTAELIADFNESHGAVGRDCRFVADLRKAGLTDAQIVKVLVTILSTCPHCYDASRMCRCSDDS